MLSRRKDRRELLETLRRMKNDSVAILREERGRVGFVPGQGLVERVLKVEPQHLLMYNQHLYCEHKPVWQATISFIMSVTCSCLTSQIIIINYHTCTLV